LSETNNHVPAEFTLCAIKQNEIMELISQANGRKQTKNNINEHGNNN